MNRSSPPTLAATAAMQRPYPTFLLVRELGDASATDAVNAAISSRGQAGLASPQPNGVRKPRTRGRQIAEPDRRLQPAGRPRGFERVDLFSNELKKKEVALNV